MPNGGGAKSWQDGLQCAAGQGLFNDKVRLCGHAHALLGSQGQGIAIVGLQHIGRGHRMRLAIDLEQQGPVMGPPGVTQAAVVQQIIGVLRGAVLGQIPRRGDRKQPPLARVCAPRCRGPIRC